MPIPAQFQKGGEKGPPADDSKNISVSDALDALEARAQSPRARAALKTLRAELEEGGARPERKAGSTADAKSEALARLKG